MKKREREKQKNNWARPLGVSRAINFQSFRHQLEFGDRLSRRLPVDALLANECPSSAHSSDAHPIKKKLENEKKIKIKHLNRKAPVQHNPIELENIKLKTKTKKKYNKKDLVNAELVRKKIN